VACDPRLYRCSRPSRKNKGSRGGAQDILDRFDLDGDGRLTGDERHEAGRFRLQQQLQLPESFLRRFEDDSEQAPYLVVWQASGEILKDWRSPPGFPRERPTLPDEKTSSQEQDEGTAEPVLGRQREQFREFALVGPRNSLILVGRSVQKELDDMNRLLGWLIVEDCAELTKPLAERRGITFDLDLTPVELNADSEQIARVVINLFTNAINYNREDGRVHVGLTTERHEAVLTVHDSGIGIAQDDVPGIFDRFQRLDKARSRELGGSGLGLAIARAIVNAHGGTLECESEVGEGSTFTVRLPGGVGEAGLLEMEGVTMSLRIGFGSGFGFGQGCVSGRSTRPLHLAGVCVLLVLLALGRSVDAGDRGVAGGTTLDLTFEVPERMEGRAGEVFRVEARGVMTPNGLAETDDGAQGWAISMATRRLRPKGSVVKSLRFLERRS
jgi:two-component sensor histidine kinase